ncbi:MAG: aromatic ring-hydroxylating dioxygenase subunit alpha [Blastocatellia bacterium]|nr:aromatic ring-hydroxylating dioxygenase subunit alpha [Blastocatellia bacterium]
MSIKLESEINKFDSNVAIEAADTPPSSWYLDPQFFELDKKVLISYWQFVASLDQFSETGSYLSGSFCGEPYFIVKTETGDLKAFFNVCRHHAAELLHGEGCTKDIVCPYHAWNYSLDGQLKKAPQMAGVKNFSREKLSLSEIPLKIWNKFVLLDFSGNAKPLDDDLNRFDQRLVEAQTNELKFIGRRVYEIKCNWKVYIDNYLDGGYHVDHLHKGLAGQLKMDDYKVENYKTWTLQSCAASPNPTQNSNIDFKERIGKEALYAWIYPNFMINRYGNIMDTNWIVPLAPDHCLTIFDYYFLPDTSEDFITASIKASEQVQIEDVSICESVQRGLSSKSYTTGRYAPTLEGGAYLLHQLLKKDYLVHYNIDK